MSQGTLSLARTLARISELAPDLIRTEPREALLGGSEEYGPLLYWVDTLIWRAGFPDALAIRVLDADDLDVYPADVPRILPGLIVCCEVRGWEMELRSETQEDGSMAYGARLLSNGPSASGAPTFTHALATVILLKLLEVGTS
ncbi:hypothetical protein [Deinococcus sp.]|uniref:hypothetical protein n=1 Tax=Deinococcus sp. TaxID=47478 RepID=UPI0025DEB3BE|nr:hypothetical protein [Deinococcus sp.]